MPVSSTAELDARLELIENALFPQPLDESCGLCGSDECCAEGLSVSEEFTGVVLDGVERAIETLTFIAENGEGKDALEASNLLLQYGLALVDRGRA